MTMTPEQMQLLRDTAASDKGNVICIAILNLLQLAEEQKARLDDVIAAETKSCYYCDSKNEINLASCCSWYCSDCDNFSTTHDVIEAMSKAAKGNS